MMSKVKSLRSCPALEDFEVKELEQDKPKLYKHLKDTPAVKEKLKYIERLDNEIKETMQVYKAERAERLQIQNEMCNEICKNPFPGKDAQMFLELCHFEADGDLNEEEKGNKEKSEAVSTNQSNRSIEDSFIKRNIELARQGSMAGCSLTDEEKRKLEELLVDEQDGSYNVEANPHKKDSGLSLDESDESSEDENYFISNAYALDNDDITKMEDINSELEKFTVDETEKEKTDLRESSTQPQTDWKDAVLMEQRLKAINAKLDELRNSYETDQVEEIFMRMVKSGTLDKELSKTGRSNVDVVNAATSQKDEDQA
ncbi:uncharacterized protein LOC108908450 [Anoplophora glabripennis]|uniref:uncharacterized protein LOC108908450 n=1 Tax=Anoplophora glabripennis TaxID=217634 RepID=UPI0008745900|nr:uncharacterized protein LOC108908450 [Anoplophora glabripennis]